MIFFAIFFLEFISLFFLSRKLTRLLSGLFFRLTRSQTATVQILSFLFLPGIILHELSHLLLAAVLFVPVGEMEFLPKIAGSEVKLGSVAIGKTDPLRRALIGLAPILVGLFFLYAVVAFYPQGLIQPFSLFGLVLFYVVFQIANTMFSSLKDLEGLLEVILAAVFLGLVFYLFSQLANFNLLTINLSLENLQDWLSPLVTTLGMAILIDSLFLILLKIRE